MTGFIQTYDNILSKRVCTNIIDKFENNQDIFKGGIIGGFNNRIKNTTDLEININKPSEFIEIYNLINSKLDIYVQEYFKNINLQFQSQNNLKTDYYHLIMRYTKNNGKYVFHNDLHYNEKEDKPRILTYLFYLNTIEEGGETEFIDGTKIKPEAGKLLFFPATWTYVHKGNTPISSNKYICTGWLYNNN